MPDLNKAIELMRYWCNDASVGYDQWQRWDVYDGGETDCSALVITALKQAGFDVGNATYTGNMSDELCARGWTRLDPIISSAKPGDILLNDANHTAMVVSGSGWDAKICQASIDENGNAYGGMAGDQTGWETAEMHIYDYPWNAILRWNGSASDYGWIQDENGWWYKLPDESYPKDTWYWVDADAAWYYFNPKGYAITGWLLYDDEWYYFDEGTCRMHTGWLWWEEHWYWFNRSGAAACNTFMLIDDKWYGFDHDCMMITKTSQLQINKKKGNIYFRA